MSNGKAECGINWSDDEDNNAKKILEDCKGTEVKDPTEFTEGRENVKFFYLNNGWKCRCGVPTQERNMDEKPSSIIILQETPADVSDSVFQP